MPEKQQNRMVLILKVNSEKQNRIILILKAFCFAVLSIEAKVVRIQPLFRL